MEIRGKKVVIGLGATDHIGIGREQCVTNMGALPSSGGMPFGVPAGDPQMRLGGVG